MWNQGNKTNQLILLDEQDLQQGYFALPRLEPTKWPDKVLWANKSEGTIFQVWVLS